MGLFQAVAGLIFLLSVLSTGGLFAYRKMVEGQLNNLKTELATLESRMNKEDIDKLVSFDRKINSARELLVNHVAASNFLKLLEANTVAPLYYTSFKYNAPANQDISVQLEGKADSYRVVSEQEKIFLKNPNTVSVEFKDLNSDESRRSSFVLNGVFHRDAVKFQSSIDDAMAISTSTSKTATTTNVKSNN